MGDSNPRIQSNRSPLLIVDQQSISINLFCQLYCLSLATIYFFEQQLDTWRIPNSFNVYPCW